MTKKLPSCFALPTFYYYLFYTTLLSGSIPYCQIKEKHNQIPLGLVLGLFWVFLKIQGQVFNLFFFPHTIIISYILI